jgi:pyruvate/2-oxoacid:ferredoxin oxidoreductase beta subunit
VIIAAVIGWCDAIATTFASAPAFATGVSVVTELNSETHPTICWAGDGGTYDIGIASLSVAAERNEDILYICYDNEIYGKSGLRDRQQTLALRDP